MRVAVGQISSESNHFVTHPCELDFFLRTGFLLEKGQVFDLRGTGGEIAGMLSVLESEIEVDVLPLIAARANSSGPLSEHCYDHLRNSLLGALQEVLPVDGVLLSHHGSMAAIGEDDPEGDLALAIRRQIGVGTPIVMTLDLHGNVTRRMVESCTAILGYEQYPHHDTFETGARAAILLLRALRGEISPAMSYAKLPLLLTAFQGTTQDDMPFSRLMRDAKSLERGLGILSTSLFFVGSYIDVMEMGCGAMVISDGDLNRSVKESRALATEFWRVRNQFVVQTHTVPEAIRLGRSVDGGPVLLLDTADTTGGGAAGDGAGLIRGLIEEVVPETSLAMVVDPEAAHACAEAGTGRDVNLRLGHKLDPQWGSPVNTRAKVTRLFDGNFRYGGGILGGTSSSMGPSAVVTVGNLSILIASYATYDWADEQYRCADLDPLTAKFIGVKNMMNFRYGYPYARGHFVLNLPGPTPPDMRMLPFHRVRRPVFPLDFIDVDPEAEIYTSKLASPRTP